MTTQNNNRECEICDLMALCYLHNNIWMCNTCWIKEQRAKIEAHNASQITPIVANSNPIHAIDPINVNSVLKEASTIDSQIQVKTDIFNAKTAAIKDIKDAIDADEAITNKPYALAEFLKNRYTHLKTVIFEQNQIIIDAGNEQKAIQVYLNELANKLRAEEREKLKIADINYQPSAAKISKPKAIKNITTTTTAKKTKFDKVELRKAALALGVSEFTLQMVAVQKGCTISEAVDSIKASIAAAKKG